MAEVDVVSIDGMFSFVSPLELDRLIESEGIVKFLRRNSWVYLGVEQTRATSRTVDSRGESRWV